MSITPPFDRLRLYVGWLVAGLWGSTVIANVVDPTRPIPPTLQIAMTVVMGALFAPSITGRGKP